MLRPLRDHPRLVDAVLAGVLVVAGLVEGGMVETNRPLWLHQTVTVR